MTLEQYLSDQLQAAVTEKLTCRREGCGCEMIEDPHAQHQTPVALWCWMCGWRPGEPTTPKPPAELHGIH